MSKEIIDRLKEKLAIKKEIREVLQVEQLKFQERRSKIIFTPEGMALEFLINAIEVKTDGLTEEIETLKGKIHFNL